MRLPIVLAAILLCSGAVQADPVFYVTDQPSCYGFENFLGWIDPATGAMMPIAPLDRYFRSIAFGDDGVLYGISEYELYRIDADTGATTEVGILGTAVLRGLTAAGPGQLWSLEWLNDSADTVRLYNIDTTSGVATLIGPVDGLHAQDSGSDLAMVDSVLYTVGWSVGSIDPSTLTFNFIGSNWELETAAGHDDLLWATSRNTAPDPGDCHTWIGTVDTGSGDFSPTAQIYQCGPPRGLAIREGTPPSSSYSPCPPPEVPATSRWGLLVLALLIALVPLPWLLAKRRRSS